MLSQRDYSCTFSTDSTKLYRSGLGLPDEIIAVVKPFIPLSTNALLSKCLDGKTHNQKESVNSIIWNRLPKSIFVGATVLELGVYDAVAPFDIGSGAPTDILQEEGLHPGCYFEGIWKADKKRV